MKSFREIIFWLHLIAGVLAGIFIFIMCVTGALLAFESNILEYAESEMRAVEIPSVNAFRLPISEIVGTVQAVPTFSIFPSLLNEIALRELIPLPKVFSNFPVSILHISILSVAFSFEIVTARCLI